MLSRPTVIVIGAGASFELGLPVGSDLKKSIAALLDITFPDGYNQKSGDFQIKELVKARSLDRNETDWNPVLHKCWLLRDALPGSLSIDNLMDAHRADEDITFIGKLAIAKAILAAERKSKLFREIGDREFTFADVADTWLVPFFQIASEGVARENAASIFDNVTFIVFNYDRCVERFLPVALKLYYHLNDAEAAEIAEKVRILHPYGQVGSISHDSGLDYVPFGSDRYDLSKVAESIKTFCEGLHNPEQRATITESIQRAAQVVFLGFAFHPLNMGLMASEPMPAMRKIFGTTVGLSEAAIRAIKSSLFTTFHKRDTRLGGIKNDFELDELNLEGKTAHIFLTEYFRGIAD